MQPINSKVYLLQILLWTLAAAFTLVGFLYPHQDLNIYPAVWGYIIDGETQHPLVLGVINLTHLAFFLGFLLLYLNFEFYGFKSGFYGVLALTLLMACVFGTITGLNELAEKASHRTFFDRRILMFFTLTPREFTSQLAGYAAGMSSLFLLAGLVRKATTNYFMFLRFTLSSLIGFTIFVGLQTYLNYGEEYAPDSLLLFAATPTAQFAALTILSVIPLYILRLFLSFFRGRLSEETVSTTESSHRSVSKAEGILDWAGKIFSWFIFFPAFFGGLTAGAVFGGAKGYALALKHGLIQSAPAFFERIAADPNVSAKQLGLLAALIVIVFNFVFGIAPAVLKGAWKIKKKKSTTQPASGAPLPEKPEETVSEKVNVLRKPA